jgi:hypothetical protein
VPTEFFRLGEEGTPIQQSFYNVLPANIRQGNNFVEPPILLVAQTPLAEQTTAPDSSADSPIHKSGQDTEHQKLSANDHFSNIPMSSGVFADRIGSAAGSFVETNGIAGPVVQLAAQSHHGQALPHTHHMAMPLYNQPLLPPGPAFPAHSSIQTTLSYAVEVHTEHGRGLWYFTPEDWAQQLKQHRVKLDILGGGWTLGLAGYIERFGPLNPKINEGWGNSVWTGMRNWYCHHYRHQEKACGTRIGWFWLPEPYSKLLAHRHIAECMYPQTVRIPAIFSAQDQMFPDADVQVVTFLQLLEQHRPWPISASRVYNTVPLVIVQ